MACPCGGLLALPAELLLVIVGASRLGAIDLLALARVSCACRAAAEAELVWQALLERHLQPMVAAFFDGELPRPADGMRWKEYYFVMHRQWKHFAQQRTGRLLVQIGTQRLSGRGRHETATLQSLWNQRAPDTYGVYDVSTFHESHPGIDLREVSASSDATEWFEMAAHSDAALARLSLLAVPGLEMLPYDHELEALLAASSRWRSQWGSAGLLALAVAATAACALLPALRECDGPHGVSLCGPLACGEAQAFDADASEAGGAAHAGGGEDTPSTALCRAWRWMLLLVAAAYAVILGCCGREALHGLGRFARFPLEHGTRSRRAAPRRKA